MARLTVNYGFVWDDNGEVTAEDNVNVYGKLVVVSTEDKLQSFYTSYSSLLPWAGPDDADGYYIAYTSDAPRNTPVEEVMGNVGFLRASDSDPTLNQSKQDFIDFVALRFDDPSITTGAAAQTFLTNNQMWSTWDLYN